MSPQENNLLIDYLDQSLEGSELNAVENLIRNDEAAAREWKLLKFTVAGLQDAGLYEQITAVKKEYSNTKKADQQTGKKGILVTMSQRVLRVAAVLLLLSISAALFKYISVNNTSIYNEYYSSYELNTSRTAGENDQLDNAFRDRKWGEVITIVKGVADKNSKHFFVAGVANMELKQYEQAINSFKTLLENNISSGDDYFNDEAEYYLAMSYLAHNEGNKALAILEKIKKDKSHLYHEAVNKMGLDFTIFSLKEHK
jgi:tetratricopeptide (TPR) repeat protein